MVIPIELDANKLIELLGLQELEGEGGMYAISYRSADQIGSEGLPGRFGSARCLGSAIYYLLTAEPASFSAMHCLKSDEIYHFYLGDPVEMLMLLPDGSSRLVILGQDLLGGQQVQQVVPYGAWQGSHLLPGGRFALLGTTLAPGYTPADFELGERWQLEREYPGQADLIRRLTRGDKTG